MNKGYGTFGNHYSFGGQEYIAHRLMWIKTHGKIPPQMCICHHCDNRSCVRPNHLFMGTNNDNVQDMMRKGRHVTLRGEARLSSRFKNKDIREIRRRAAHGEFYKLIAKSFDTSEDYVHEIVHYEAWGHLK